MHIIKITPMSFKIILSKEDLQRHGVDNIIEKNDLSGDFFAEIIEKTNALYGNPFTEGAIDAEFFASKDGGGELFICSSKSVNKSTTYLFRTESSDSLVSLCARLAASSLPYDSKLYYENGRYNLLLFYGKRDDFLVSCMKEYGSAAEISKLQMWLLLEHSRIICDKNAVERLSGVFSQSTKPK